MREVNTTRRGVMYYGNSLDGCYAPGIGGFETPFWIDHHLNDIARQDGKTPMLLISENNYRVMREVGEASRKAGKDYPNLGLKARTITYRDDGHGCVEGGDFDD